VLHNANFNHCICVLHHAKRNIVEQGTKNECAAVIWAQQSKSLQKTCISCCWWTHMMHCIMENVLQTKMNARCDKLVTELSWQFLRWLTFSSYSKLFVKSPILTYSTCIWHLCWGDPVQVLWRSSASEN